MREKRFKMTLPEEMVAVFGWAEDEVPARVREVLVMALLRRHAVSQRKAAELLKLSLRDLFEVMGRYKVPTIDLTPEELQHELTAVCKPHQYLSFVTQAFERKRFCSPRQGKMRMA